MLKNNTYNILTPSGFQEFSGIRKVYKDEYFIIYFDNDMYIICSVEHPFIKDGIIIEANTLLVGNYIDAKNGKRQIITDIIYKNEKIELYDIMGVDSGNIFVVNDIISHNCDFISSGKTVVPGAVIEEYRKIHMCDPIEKRGIDQNIWIYKFPENGRSYVVSADVARGDGKDYSAFHIIDIDTMEQVVEYKGKIDTKMFGDLLVNISTEYNDSLLIVENNNIGWATLQQVIDRNYKNLFYSTRDFQYIDVKQHLTNKFNAQERKMIPGFTTTSKTRPLIIAKLDEYFRDRSVIIHSQRLINELFVFIYDNNRTGAASGYNDDLVMSLSIGLWVRDTALRLRTEGQDLQKQILGHTLQHSSVYTQDDTKVAEGWQWEVQGKQDDLTWLIG